ncbi:MAG: SRPBCC domain-containing protein [Solirubrobacteraceae bacterium]|nr:SRPBCC domain-containing protein [Solirubrobacteraceae bacterium]
MSDTITVTRTFSAPRERVFAAWTTPEQFSAWFGTAAVEVPMQTLSLDVRVGGQWEAVMHLPGGDTINWAGEYSVVDPPAQLVFTMTDQPGTDPGAPITVDFVAVDGGTEMTLVQPAGDFTAEQQAATAAGYQGFFDVMEELVTEG